jgi:hypothetical protein
VRGFFVLFFVQNLETPLIEETDSSSTLRIILILLLLHFNFTTHP